MARVTPAGRLPTFFVVGVAKAGTTSLYHYLAQHPDIYMSPVKEPRFFALEGHSLDFPGPGDERVRETTTTTFEAYRALFDGVRGERAVGEASVIYLYHPGAAAAIARAIPDARIIALLRDPADRAYAAYLYQVRDGYEPLTSFEEGLAAEPRRMAGGWFPVWFYRDQGFYHRGLARYYERFDPTRIRVYLHDELAADPRAVLADAYRFLGVDDGFQPDVRTRYNPGGRPRSMRVQRFLTRRHPAKEAAKRVIPEDWGHRLISFVQPANLARPPVSPETRTDLVDGYADDIEQLEGLIGRDLSSWRR